MRWLFWGGVAVGLVIIVREILGSGDLPHVDVRTLGGSHPSMPGDNGMIGGSNTSSVTSAVDNIINSVSSFAPNRHTIDTHTAGPVAGSTKHTLSAGPKVSQPGLHGLLSHHSLKIGG